MKKLLFWLTLSIGLNVFSQTVVTVREPGLVESLIVGTGGIVSGLFGMTKALLVGQTVTYTTNGLVTVPSCAVVQPTPVYYTQPAVIPSAPPVVVTPAVQPVVAVQQPVVAVPCQTTVVYLPYRGWGPPPMRPRHYYHPCPAPYPGPYPRPPLR